MALAIVPSDNQMATKRSMTNLEERRRTIVDSWTMECLRATRRWLVRNIVFFFSFFFLVHTWKKIFTRFFLHSIV